MDNELNFKRIGQKIRDVRIEKQLTQEFIANYASVNTSHISNIETGKAKVSLTVLVFICNALDVTVDYILENEYNRQSTIIDKEVMNIMITMIKEKKEQLLRIAKVL